MPAPKSFVLRLVIATSIVLMGPAHAEGTWDRLLPFGVAMSPADRSTDVDPRQAVTVEAVGFGTRLARVRIEDGQGRVLTDVSDRAHVSAVGPFDFGTTYRLVASAERGWTGQRATYEMSFTTVAKPVLEGPLERGLGSDGTVHLRFDRPVGPISAQGSCPLRVEREEGSQVVRLIPENCSQGQTLNVALEWATTTGVTLAPLNLSLRMPPPLTAEITPRDKTNLGVAMPIEITFSESLANREQLSANFLVRTKEGQPIEGRWLWFGKSKVQFHPRPQWPASSLIEAELRGNGLRSAQGGTLEQPLEASFTTGSDRRIYVYLDSQRMSAVENGQVVKTFKVSTGKAKTPTVAGSFYIYARFPLKTMKSRAKPGQPGHYVVENVPFAQYFHTDYAFHGAWWHNAFGRPASHGCVNMSTRSHNRRWPSAPEDAGWLYNWASLGVPVTVLHGTGSQQVALQ